MKNIVVNHRWSAVVLALGALCGPVASAQTAQEELQQLRATTQALINTLVESGLLTREKAAAMLKQVQPSASSTPAAPVAAATAPAAEVGSDGKRVVRVPYVSESVRQEMREQIKAEVLTQAKTERWGQANAYPEWLSRFQFDGDLRGRAGHQIDLGRLTRLLIDLGDKRIHPPSHQSQHQRTAGQQTQIAS